MTSDLLVELLQTLDAPQGRICDLERRYTGHSPLAFLAPEAKAELGNRLSRLASDLPRLAVTSLAERLRITGFTGADVWDEWLRLDGDQLSAIAHREALAFGSSMACVWADSQGRPTLSIESPKQVAVLRDPGTREVVAAVKRWKDTTHGKSESHAMLYLPDRLERWTSNHADASATDKSWSLVETLDNWLGQVNVVQLKNCDLLLDDWGASEIDPIASLVDALHKILADMMVTSETAARPMRWISGLSLVERDVLDENGEPTGEHETVSPIEPGSRLAVSEAEATKFGQLDPADLSSYRNAVDVLMQQVMAASALPEHMVGVTKANPSSSEAIKSAEAGLTSKATDRQKVFGRAWEQVARLLVAVRDGVDPADVDVRVQWADPSTRSEAAAADSAVKLYTAGVLSRAGTLKRLGFSDDEIEAELEAGADQAINEGPGAGLYGRRGNVRNIEALGVYDA